MPTLNSGNAHLAATLDGLVPEANVKRALEFVQQRTARAGVGKMQWFLAIWNRQRCPETSSRQLPGVIRTVDWLFAICVARVTILPEQQRHPPPRHLAESVPQPALPAAEFFVPTERASNIPRLPCESPPHH